EHPRWQQEAVQRHNVWPVHRGTRQRHYRDANRYEQDGKQAAEEHFNLHGTRSRYSKRADVVNAGALTLGDFVVRSRFIVAAIRFSRRLPDNCGSRHPERDDSEHRTTWPDDFVVPSHVIVALVRVFVVSSRTN